MGLWLGFHFGYSHGFLLCLVFGLSDVHRGFFWLSLWHPSCWIILLSFSINGLYFWLSAFPWILFSFLFFSFVLSTQGTFHGDGHHFLLRIFLAIR